MELVYLWISNFRNITNQEFIFDKSWDIKYDQREKILNISKIGTDLPDSFWGESITNISVVIGENGAGKSQLLQFIFGFLENNFIPDIIVLKVKERGRYVLKTFYHESLGELNINPQSDNFEKPQQHSQPINSVLHSYLSDKLRILYLNFGLNHHRFHGSQFSIDLSTRKFIDTPSSFSVKTLQSSAIEVYLLEEAQRMATFVKSESFIKSGLIPYTRLKQVGLHFKDSLAGSAAWKLLSQINSLPIFAEYRARLFDESYDKSYRRGDWIETENPEIARIYFGLAILEKFDAFPEKLSASSIDDLTLLIKQTVLDADVITQVYKEFYQFIWREAGQSISTEIRVGPRENPFWDFIDFVTLQFRIDTDRLEDLLSIYRGTLTESREGKDAKPLLGFYWALSAGEHAFVSYFSRIYDVKNELNEVSSIWLLFDEIDLHLHPIWQRQFIAKMIEFLGRALPPKNVQLIFNTHSPILLGDIPVRNAIFMTRDEDGNGIADAEGIYTQTFGSNIHQLFAESFILGDSLMGDFARDKIRKIILEVRSIEYFTSAITKEMLDRVNLVGEPFIRYKLLEYMQRNSTDQEIKDVINTEIDKILRKIELSNDKD